MDEGAAPGRRCSPRLNDGAEEARSASIQAQRGTLTTSRPGRCLSPVSPRRANLSRTPQRAAALRAYASGARLAWRPVRAAPLSTRATGLPCRQAAMVSAGPGTPAARSTHAQSCGQSAGKWHRQATHGGARSVSPASRTSRQPTRRAPRSRRGGRERGAQAAGDRRFSHIVVSGWLPGISGRVLGGGARRRARLPAVGAPQRQCRHRRRGDARAIARPPRAGVVPTSVGSVGQVASKVHACGLARRSATAVEQQALTPDAREGAGKAAGSDRQPGGDNDLLRGAPRSARELRGRAGGRQRACPPRRPGSRRGFRLSPRRRSPAALRVGKPDVAPGLRGRHPGGRSGLTSLLPRRDHGTSGESPIAGAITHRIAARATPPSAKLVSKTPSDRVHELERRMTGDGHELAADRFV